MHFQRVFQIHTLLWVFLVSETGLAAVADMESYNVDFNRDDLYDRTTNKLKPIREVIDDHSAKDFPVIRDCGLDDTQNLYEADPEDCSCYFLCIGKYYVHRKCSPGLLFDSTTHDCNWPEVVDCHGRPAPWTIPEYLGPHNIHEHYNVYQYTNSKLIMDRNNKDQREFDDEDGHSYVNEYFM